VAVIDEPRGVTKKFYGSKEGVHVGDSPFKANAEHQGPCQWKRRLLASVVESQLLYATSVWSEAVSSTAKARTILRRPQKVTALQRTIRAYRTVSDEAAIVLSVMPPVEMIAEERARIKARVSEDPFPSDSPPTRIIIKKEERRTTIAEWQRR